MGKSKVSVIVPVYKVEDYIERCVRSLFGQTLMDMEFVFVDDCSLDKSIEIVEAVLDEFPARRQQVKIIRNEHNKGVSFVRNLGIEVATGDYICYCDSDDWVELDTYERLYDKANSTGSDICWCDFYMHNPNGVEYCKALDILPDKMQLLRAYIMNGWTVVWNMLVKREVYDKGNIRCYDGYNFCEDYGLTVRLLYHATKVSLLPNALYHYNRTNQNSIVATSLDVEKIKKITNDQVAVYCLINDFFKEKGLYEQLKDVLSYRMLCGKRGWLMDKDKKKEYRDLYPESNAYIWSNPLCSTKDKICQTIIVRPYLSFLLPIMRQVNSLTTKWKR